MEWNNKIEAGKKDSHRKRLLEYEAITEMTKEERKELREWVADNHDPLDNPWYIYWENGLPMDYIQALREVIRMCEDMKNLTSEELVSIYEEQRNEKASNNELDDLTSDPLIF
jgi:hypothetical protein